MLTTYCKYNPKISPTLYRDDRTEMVIEWNGSATFNVKVDGVDVDCFTVYGKAQPAGPCTPSEAYEAAQAHFAQMETTQ